MIDLPSSFFPFPRVIQNINKKENGKTSLHRVAALPEKCPRPIVYLLLQAGADPRITDLTGNTLLDKFKELSLGDTNASVDASIQLLEIAMLQPERNFLLLKTRLIAVASSGRSTPSFLQKRAQQKQELPRISIKPLSTENQDKKLNQTMEFMLRTIGEGMPSENFRLFFDMLLPQWDPLRKSAETQ